MSAKTCFITITSLVLSTFGMQCNCCCTHPFSVVGSQCLYVDQDVRHWSGACDECRKLGAVLASVRNFTEVVDSLKSFWDERGGFWIAGSDRDNEGTWTWRPSGKPIPSDHWAPGEPNNGNGHSSGEEHCLELRKNGFVDSPCTFHRRFLCEDVTRSEVETTTTTISSGESMRFISDDGNATTITPNNNATAPITKEPVECSYCKKEYTAKTALSVFSAILIFVIIGLLSYIYKYCEGKDSEEEDNESVGKPISRPAWPPPAPKVLPI